MRESVVDCSYYLSANSGSALTSAGFLIVVLVVLININIIPMLIIIIVHTIIIVDVNFHTCPDLNIA